MKRTNGRVGRAYQGDRPAPPAWVGGWAGYLLTFLMQVVLTVILVELRRIFPDVGFRIPFVFLAMAVVYLFGLGPAIFSGFLSLIAYDCLYAQPRNAFGLGRLSADDQIGLLLLAIGLVAGTWGIYSLRCVTTRLRAEVEDHRRAEEALRESEERLRGERTILDAIAENTDAHLAYLDPEFNFVWVNKAYARAAKRRPEDLIGRNHFDIYPHPENEGAFRRVRDTGERLVYRAKPFEHPDQPERGTTYWDWTLTPIKDSAGRVQGLVLSLTDVTEIKRSEEEFRRQQALLSTVLNTVPVGVVLSDEQGALTYFSPGAVDIFGGRPTGTAAGSEPGTYELLHPGDRRPFDSEELPLVHALRTGECTVDSEILIRRPDGSEVTVLAVACPVKDSEGRVTGSVAALTDITEMDKLRRELAEDRARLSALYAIAEVGITARNLQDALETIASRMREVLGAHSCSIFTYDEDRNEFVARAASDLPNQVGRRLPGSTGVEGIILRERRPVYVSDAEHDPLVQDPAEKKAGIKAVLAVPLIARGRLTGMARVDETRERRFSEDEVAVFESMAARAALIIENAQLVESLAANYQLLQRALLPPEPPDVQGFRIAARYLPGARGAEIGGDFYDVFETEDGHLGVLIGDVTGKGIPSASLATDTRSTVRAFTYDTSEPGTSLSHSNSVICKELQDYTMFVTVLAAVIDRSAGRIRYANAGHPPVAVWRSESGEVEFTAFGNPPVGVASEMHFEEYTLDLAAGDKVVFYTDGLSEARRGGEMYGQERIAEVIREHGCRSPEDVVTALVDAATSWSDGRLTDDTAVIVIECEQG